MTYHTHIDTECLRIDAGCLRLDDSVVDAEMDAQQGVQAACVTAVTCSARQGPREAALRTLALVCMICHVSCPVALERLLGGYDWTLGEYVQTAGFLQMGISPLVLPS